VPVPLLAHQSRDHGHVGEVGEHLEAVDDAHGGVDQRVRGDFEDAIVQPDLAAALGEEPELVAIVIVGLDARPLSLVRHVTYGVETRPLRVDSVLPVVGV